ncbi:AAA family ATPase [Alicyclobacillus tolerans]|uniref:AAA family ATPase n=1 Tax=Alicyclobacillus tolerans TaxID=90970 RepID=UPI001F021095|nr:AAA family ATPase [Alicyclobacillus tolerans]MCF8568021.1 AAA family ATPase [Alicyclobacillus tolerans]
MMTMTNANQTVAKMNDIRSYLTQRFMEREDVIDGFLTALVARVHILLVGPPGSAKSAITVALSELIDGFDYFQWLFTKFTTPEEIFGPFDLSKLKQGLYERITNGKLPVAHMGYADEVFKSNSAILNALLTLMNERVFYNGTKQEISPLMTLVGTSNEYPMEEELQAVFDRFMLRFEPGYIKEDANFATMLLQTTAPKPAPMTLAELEAMQYAADHISVDAAIVDALIALKADLAQDGIFLSDRRWVQVAKRLLPARAVLAGRDYIILEEDAEILQHALWEDPSQRTTVASIVRKRLDPVAGQIAELVEDARDIANNAMKASEDQAVAVGTEAIKKLKTIRNEIQAFIHTGGSPSKMDRMKESDSKVEELLKGVTKKCLGI